MPPLIRPFVRSYVQVLALVCASACFCAASDRIQIQFDTSEADQVLAIASKHNSGKAVTESDWQALFSTEPYKRLKLREASMHRDFTDEEFKKFVLSEAVTREAALRRTLQEWKSRDLTAGATRALSYLPSEAVIRTKVFPEIKPKHNSFVFDVATDPAIFLYLDPEVSGASFENTVVHEMHHIGLASLGPIYDKKIASLPAGPRIAADWIGGFGDGLAVLAAAGGPDHDPTETGSPEVKANWQAGMASFNHDLDELNDFFSQVADGKLTEAAARERGATYYGQVQGPWYTVGYRMAVLVERKYGRETLINCMLDFRRLLKLYNSAAGPNDHKWSARLLEQVQAP